MRRVAIQEYVKDGENTTSIGTPKYAWKETKEGVFHGFGSDYTEFDSGPANYSIAIVELADGQVEMVPANKIRFLEPYPERRLP